MEPMKSGVEQQSLQINGMPPIQLLDSAPRSSDPSINETVLKSRDIQLVSLGNNTIGVTPSMEGLFMDEVLLKSTRAICERYKIQFTQLTTIQRKFVTNYRCSQCGLLPLYRLNLLHVKRVRCRSCGQLISFKRKGKYGKLRKEIAFELLRRVQGYGEHAS